MDVKESHLRKLRPPRREQQRAIDTRHAILGAALSEFAEKGFEAASIRPIAERIGLRHQLITHHYRTKDDLWQAVAEHVFNRLRELWDERVPEATKMTPIERVREEYRAFFHIGLRFPDLHHFMLRESRPGSPRMPWLSERVVKPLIARLLPHIVAAQQSGDLPPGDPVLIHYMLIGMSTVLISLGAEMQVTSGRKADSPAVVANYWTLLEVVILDRKRYEQPA